MFYVDTPSLSQDFDWNKGSHSISFGGSWTRPHSDGDGTFQANGKMSFSGLITSGTTNANGGLNMADFVLGLPVGVQPGRQPDQRPGPALRRRCTWPTSGA